MRSEIHLASRRRLLKLGATAFIAKALAPLGEASASLSPARRDWRFCNKCQVLFYTASLPNSCAAGGTHVAQGYQFELDLEAPETATTQQNWRCCKKCQAMFFNGYRNKGLCPAGGAHVPDTTSRYGLKHDIAQTRNTQRNWRFCNKCHAMFFDGYPAKGRCVAGGGHVAQGFNFVLRHFG